jgi:4-hydroxybenzoate polyprenyltransferase
VLILLVTGVAVLFGRALTHGGALTVKASDLGAFAAAWAYFLLLRVFDEHKDFERDLHNHPHRVLQSGQIELVHLKFLGAVSVAVQALVSILVDGGAGRATVLWLVLMVWSLLMLKEFFLEWPPERFLLYAFMHMISMPLCFLWVAQIGAGDNVLAPGTRWLVVLGGLIAATIEVARKFKSPEDERPTIDSYTGQLGVRGASYALVGLLLAAAGVGAALLAAATDAGAPVYAGFLAAVVPGLAGAGRFARDPSATNAKQVEALAGVTVVLLLVLLIAALLGARSIG